MYKSLYHNGFYVDNNHDWIFNYFFAVGISLIHQKNIKNHNQS